MAAEPASKKARTEGSKPTLYSYWRSSCSWRVRIALNLKGVEFDYKAVHLVKDGGEQLADAYAAVNPNKVVPTFVSADEALTLTQSGAIIEYIEETMEGPRLLPVNPATRAIVRSLCGLVGADTQPVQNLRVLRKVAAMSGGDADAAAAAKASFGNWAISNGFDALEAMLAKTAGKHCVGDEVTMADLYIPPQVYNAGRYKVDMSKYPNIMRVHAALDDIPAFVAARPENQPDAQ